MDEHLQLSKKITDVGRRLYDRNLLAAADGNISYRINDDEILITPSGVSKGFLDPTDMAVINLEGKVKKGNPSSEWKMHTFIYQKCSKAKSVVHAHPPTAIAWSLAFSKEKEIPVNFLPEVILSVGKIPILSYACPGSEELASGLESWLPDCRVFVLARHGGVSLGESLDEALWGIERLEHVCQILKRAMELSPFNRMESNSSLLESLSESEIKKLQKIRLTMGGQIK